MNAHDLAGGVAVVRTVAPSFELGVFKSRNLVSPF